MKGLVIATKNKGKLREIEELLKDLNIKITSLENYPDSPEIIEDGKTFQQNAIKKAATIAFYTKKLVIGEDSGIEVKPLGNRPGIHSARYSGKNATDKKNNLKLLRELKSVPLNKRIARYRCCIAIIDGSRDSKLKDKIELVSGTCSGLISLRAKGTNGFGYDPLFLVKRYNKTFGELDPSIKSKISHRARAFKKLKSVLKKYLRN